MGWDVCFQQSYRLEVYYYVGMLLKINSYISFKSIHQKSNFIVQARPDGLFQKKKTGVGGAEGIEFLKVLKKYRVKIPGVQ